MPEKLAKLWLNNVLTMEVVVVAFLILVFVLIRSRMSVERPGGLQHLTELLNEFISNQSADIIGPHSEQFTPLLSAFFIFILFGNLIGLIPGLESPTANPAVPLGCALVAFVYYNFQGFKAQWKPLGYLKPFFKRVWWLAPLRLPTEVIRNLGRYLKHFLGPVSWLAPLMLPIEIVGNLARVMSLTIRLFANIFAGDKVTLVFISLIPIGVPVIFLLLHTGVSFLQAYIFTLLVTIYLAGAVAHEH